MLFKPSIKTIKIGPRNKRRKVFIKAGQKLDRFSIDSSTDNIYQGLMKKARQNLNRSSTDISTDISIEIYKIRISKSDFRPMLTCMCRVFFLRTLDIYKAYFKGSYIREYKENTSKKWPSALLSFKEATASLCLRVL